MKTFFKKIKETKKLLDSLELAKEQKKSSIKAMIFAAMLILMIAFPIIIVLVELFKQFPIIVPFTYFLLFLVFILFLVFPPLYMVLYFVLLKNYVEIDELKEVKTSEIFISELFNPFYLILALAVVFVIYFVL